MNWLARLFPKRTVTLVIDDGPTSATTHLLDALEAAGHRAVLFVLGSHVDGREPILIDAIRRGFAIGNHSFSHPAFSQISLEQATDEIVRTEVLIDVIYRDAGVTRPGKWFRFPYLDRGDANSDKFQDLLREKGFTVPDAVLEGDQSGDLERHDWPSTVLTRDWALPTEDAFREIVRNSRPGEVIEFHDKLETIRSYLGMLIDELAERRLVARVPRTVR